MDEEYEDLGEMRTIIDFIESVADPLNTANFILSIISFFVNCLHLFVLTRKSMKPSSTNALMIGIAISDIFTLLLTVEKHLTLVDIENNECVTSDSLLKVHVDMLAWALQDYFRRCSTWLGLLMATVRTLVVRNALTTNNSRLSKPSFGWFWVFLIFVLASSLSVFHYFRFQITENRRVPLPISCEEFQNIHKPPKYTLTLVPLFEQNDKLLLRVYSMVDAILSKFIPCLFFPILTIILVLALKKAKCTTSKSVERQDLTTKLVIFMTISFFLAEAPLGAILTIKAFFHSETGLIIASVDVIIVFACLLTINSTCHFFLCIALSRQYRTTLKRVLRSEKNARTVKKSGETWHISSNIGASSIKIFSVQ